MDKLLGEKWETLFVKMSDGCKSPTELLSRLIQTSLLLLLCFKLYKLIKTYRTKHQHHETANRISQTQTHNTQNCKTKIFRIDAYFNLHATQLKLLTQHKRQLPTSS